MEERKHIVILAAGDFPTHPIPLRALREADFVVCCDSAYTQFSTFNFQLSIPFIVIGDGDSLTEADKRALGDRWLQVDEQEYNDLVKAMRWVAANFQLSSPSFRLTILGATGLREDHTLANISHLGTFVEWWPQLAGSLEMITDHGRFTIVCGSRRYDSFSGQQVSLFALDPTAPVTVRGLRWPIEGRCLDRLWQGSLNASQGDSFEVSGQKVLVYQTHCQC